MKSYFRTGHFFPLLLSILFPVGMGLMVGFFPRHGVIIFWTGLILIGFVAALRIYSERKRETRPRGWWFQLAPAVIPLAIGLIPATNWGLEAFPDYSRWIAIAVYGVIIPLAAGSYLFFSVRSTLAVLHHHPEFPKERRPGSPDSQPSVRP